jgi:hypothetical protein
MTLGRAIAGFFTLGVAAGTSPGSQPIIGPDGTAMAHVHCGSDQGVCFRIAGELCPGGYEMKPVLSGNDGNFLVHCRDARVAASALACPAVAAAAPTPVVAVSAPTKGSSEAWPPSTEPWPAAYPWPAPEASVAVQPTKAGSPASKTTPDSVDIGY